METVPESNCEKRVRSGETNDEKEVDLQLIQQEKALSPVYVRAPQKHSLDQQTIEQFPKSYKSLSLCEIQLLAIADSFQRQYSYLYPQRKPLLLFALNECGIKKFVSTTLRPTPTAHPELYSWQGCASFVADFLSLEPLESPVELPQRLHSPTTVLQSQTATCFEYATLLCSLLLGANYDAYCVSGYAIREMCLLDQSLQECSLMDTEVKSVITGKDTNKEKPMAEFKSHFLEKQEKKEEASAALLCRRLQEDQMQQSADPLQGLRVHCWVLVLSDSRDVQENFFIDPLTGNRYNKDDNSFLGIESVWNNFNYYVNMQDCSNNLADMLYNMGDLQLWEPVLHNAISRKQLNLDVSNRKKVWSVMSKNESDEEEKDKPITFDMPRSWVSCINVSKKDLEVRWPRGHKVTRYKKAKLEKFVPYLRPNGLVKRHSTYMDLDCTEVVTEKEWYEHRKDHLEEREVNRVNNSVSERFKYGRRFHLLRLRYTDTECQMEFSDAHVDNLRWRMETAGEIMEMYEGRHDYLFYRQVIFDQNADVPDPEKKPLQKVVECFHRNKFKEASKDVAERVFLLNEGRIELRFHLEDNLIIPSSRSFVKPEASTETKKAGDFTPHMVSNFQVKPFEKPLKLLTMYHMLEHLVIEEEQVILQVRESSKEVKDILACRKQEEAHIELLISPWTITGRERARCQKEEVEHLVAKEQRWFQEREPDILAPFFIRLNDAKAPNGNNSQLLYENCVDEEHAVLIENRYEETEGGSSSSVP